MIQNNKTNKYYFYWLKALLFLLLAFIGLLTIKYEAGKSISNKLLHGNHFDTERQLKM